MVQQRSELYNLVLFSYLSHAIQRIWHILIPALRPGSVLLDHVPLGQPPSLHRLRNRRSSLVRRLRRYYGVVRLPVFVHHWITILDLPNASPLTTSTGKTRDLPVLAHGVSAHARGLRDWLNLRCTTLSFATPCRFIPALSAMPGTHVKANRRRLGRQLERVVRQEIFMRISVCYLLVQGLDLQTLLLYLSTTELPLEHFLMLHQVHCH